MKSGMNMSKVKKDADFTKEYNRKTGDIIRLIDQKDMSQSEISREVGCSRQWVSYVAKRKEIKEILEGENHVEFY